MTIYKAGDIVTIPFPYVEGKKGKVRPTLLVSNAIQGEKQYFYVVMITSKKGKNNIKGDIVIDNINDCGLIVPSIIRCSRIATLDQNMIVNKVGKMPTEFSELTNETVKGFIEL
ncbi:type II toxin-antitoxin system PemK/MazF family toxin [Candidatus Woesearchaeota archaeon]|jgi:mRNA interferase MazF|nr:type II toxin-antitoxin system PemK/MazF family toxin [Candidatus Woesearchaeota archaeon]